MPPRQRRSTQRSHAFSLIETTVSLALVSLILLSALNVLVLQPRIQDRARAGEEALHAIESALETLRAGDLPLASGELAPGIFYPVTNAQRELRVTLLVEPRETPGLFELRFVATYLTFGSTGSRQLTTMAWRPGT